MSKILIVEDENMLLEMMRAYLQAQGCETAGAKSYDDALNLARENAAKFGVEDRIEFIKCAYLDQIYGQFDLLVSNPPYIARDYRLDKFVLNEPHEALFSGAAGDEILKNIILVAKNRSVKYLACEIGYNQRESMQNALKFNGFEVEFYKDLAGFDRGFVARNIFANF